MKLIKYNQSKISDEKQVPGLVRSQIEYEVKTAQGALEYQGPKFTPELWHQVLSFFRWTNKEMQSESQVRLYVNVQLNRWAAWAFPQAARTGMTARELSVPESAEQAKARFASWQSEPSDDWLYFGTVHHHCSASAFQSSTDEQNEWNQDGLHITVGKMDQDRHDLHARFYLGGNCFEPDLSLFWPIDAELATQVPSSMHHELARYQMGSKVTVDFPDQWRHHLVEAKPDSRTLLSERNQDWKWPDELPRLSVPLHIRVGDAIEDIHQRCAIEEHDENHWMAELQALANDDITRIILEVCLQHRVTPEELLAEVNEAWLANPL